MEYIKKWGAGIAGVFVFVGSKLSWVLALLKLVKIPTLISMLVMLGTYALLFGWKFAVAVVYLIFVHEMGHLLAAKMKGIETSPAIFIPFVGAAISIKEEQIKDAKTEAFLAYGGPLAGLLSFLPAIPLFNETGDPLWALIIYLGAFINLFNLIPVSPLDGGRIVTAFSTKVWLLGLVVLLVLAIKLGNPLLFFILILGIITWYNRFTEGTKIELLRLEKSLIQKAITDIEGWTKRMMNHAGYSIEYLYHSLKTDHNWLDARIERLQEKRDHLAFWKRRDKKQLDIETHTMREQKRLLDDFLSLLEVNSESDGDGVLDEGKEAYREKILARVNRTMEKGFDLNPIEKELQKLKTYYQTDLRTKITWFTLYLTLLAVLAMFMWYGGEIMEQITGLNPLEA